VAVFGEYVERVI